MGEPRDELIDSTSSYAPNETVPATSAQIEQASGNESGSSDSTESTGASLKENASKVAKSLKPVVEAAESLASQAVSLTAKGINRLDSTLAERKQHRAENSDSAPPADSM
jgi:hypothetical protein